MQIFSIEQSETQCVVTWRHFRYTVIFEIVFFTASTAICGFITYVAFIDKRFDYLLFILPFWLLSFGLFVKIANILFGTTQLVLNADGVKTLWTCLHFRQKKQFELTDIRQFYFKVYPGTPGRTCYKLQIALRENNAEEFSTPAGKADEEEFDNLCEQLNTFLAILKQEPEV